MLGIYSYVYRSAYGAIHVQYCMRINHKHVGNISQAAETNEAHWPLMRCIDCSTMPISRTLATSDYLRSRSRGLILLFNVCDYTKRTGESSSTVIPQAPRYLSAQSESLGAGRLGIRIPVESRDVLFSTPVSIISAPPPPQPPVQRELRLFLGVKWPGRRVDPPHPPPSSAPRLELCLNCTTVLSQNVREDLPLRWQ